MCPISKMYLSCICSVDPEPNVDTDNYDAIQQWASDDTVTVKSEPVPQSQSCIEEDSKHKTDMMSDVRRSDVSSETRQRTTV